MDRDSPKHDPSAGDEMRGYREREDTRGDWQMWPRTERCGNCTEYFASFGHQAGGECDCPKCQGMCECPTGAKMNKPTQSTPAYVAARIRKLFAAKGWPIHKMSGRYSPFYSTQTGTEGFAVYRIGCSKTIGISYSGAYANGRTVDLPRGYAKERQAEAIEYLRSLGYRVDELGRIECERGNE